MESDSFNLGCHNSLEYDRKDLSSHGNLRATHGVAPQKADYARQCPAFANTSQKYPTNQFP